MAVGDIAGPRRTSRRFGNRCGLVGYLFVAPSITLLLVFVILPILAVFYYSLTD